MCNINTNPLVSVVIPTYNRAIQLRRCLDSLTAQDINAFEVIVCDDGSTDETRNVVSEYKCRLNIRYSYGDNFGRPARPRNRGIALATAPYIAFLDSDDWWTKSKLRLSIDYLDRGADFVYHDLYRCSSYSSLIPWRKVKTRVLNRPVKIDLLQNGNAINTSSVVTRKALLLITKGFPEDSELENGEDYVAWLKISDITENFVRINQTLGFFYVGNTSSTTPLRLLKMAKFIETNYLNNSNLCKIRIPDWLIYSKGRSYYKLKLYTKAYEQLSLIILSRNSISVALKILWMLTQYKINYIVQKYKNKNL